MTRWLIGGIGSLLLIGLLILAVDYFNRPEAVSSGPETADNPTETATKQQPEQAAIQRTKRSAEPSVAPPEETRPSQPEAPSAKNPPGYEQFLGRPPATSGPVDVLKRAFNKESADANAREAERLVRSVLGADIIPAGYLRSVTCRNTVCKIGVYWSKEQPLPYMAVAMKVGMQQGGIIAFEPNGEPDGDGKVPIDMYVVRSGYSLDDIK